MKKELKNLKLTDLVKESELDPEALSKLKGGVDISLFDCCITAAMCSSQAEVYCSGGSICTISIRG
jgi:hypothetical protein